MRFDDLDARMRVFETAYDLCVVPEMYMVARIDGRGFTRLTKEVLDLERPFDARFRDLMVATVEHLMSCGFAVRYGYTQSDEISLLIDRDETAFGRKLRKYDSILAGEASAKFSLLAGTHACFDARISQLPNAELVVDYFRWRREDARRNALNAHVYWLLRGQGRSPRAAHSAMLGLSVPAQHELLFQAGIVFEALPAWQRHGTGVFWETYAKPAFNPRTGEHVVARRRRLKTEHDLPDRDAYADFVRERLTEASPQS